MNNIDWENMLAMLGVGWAAVMAVQAVNVYWHRLERDRRRAELAAFEARVREYRERLLREEHVVAENAPQEIVSE